MLKLVLGGSGSGKTTLLYARIKARAEAGQRSILLASKMIAKRKNTFFIVFLFYLLDNVG